MDLILDFEQNAIASGTRRLIKLHGCNLPKVYLRTGIYFDLVDENPPEPLVLDGFMFGFIFAAMARADRFIINGAISGKAMRNIQIFQEAWTCWRPDLYKIVEIVPNRIIQEWCFTLKNKETAIAAFSGGADATFLVLRHAAKSPSFFDLKTVVTIHGFDVPIEREDAMLRLNNRVYPLLKSLGIQQRILKTNVRQPEMADSNNSIQAWEHCHGALIACALHQYSANFDYGIIGSSDPYSYPAIEWGSTPATDYLLSGGELEIVHDGAGYSRVEKIELINKNPAARKSLKVCWEGSEHDKNCGTCDKCAITRLSFAAIGETNPPCFDGEFCFQMIDDLILNNDNHFSELLSILDYATAREVDQYVVQKIRDVIEDREKSLNLVPISWSQRKKRLPRC